MEMPEGWKSLKSVVDSIEVKPNDPRNYDHAQIAQIVVHSMWNTPLDLMKEMAEALELSITLPVLNEHSYAERTQFEKDKIDQQKIRTAFKKFKEWK